MRITEFVGRGGGEPQRIALLDPGGFSPQYDMELTEALIRAGCEVALFGRAGSMEAVPAAYSREHFYRPLAGVAGARLSKVAARLVKGLFHLSDMARLSAELGAWRAEVLHIQWSPLPLIDKWIVRSLRRQIPVVLTLHDSNPYNGAGVFLMRAGYRELVCEADAIIVHTQQALHRLTVWGLDSSRIHQLPHGLIHIRSTPTSRSRPNRPERLILLQFGKIKHYKGVDVLLRALALLPPQVRKKLEIRIVGEPHMDTTILERFAIENGLSATVQFRFQFVTEAQVKQLFAEADAIILPYREIDASGVAMAAIASGLPVLASAIGGFVELFGDGTGARLVPPENPVALASALREWADAPDKLLELRAAMRVRRDLVPSWDEIAEQTRAVYAQARFRWALEHPGTTLVSGGD